MRRFFLLLVVVFSIKQANCQNSTESDDVNVINKMFSVLANTSILTYAEYLQLFSENCELEMTFENEMISSLEDSTMREKYENYFVAKRNTPANYPSETLIRLKYWLLYNGNGLVCFTKYSITPEQPGIYRIVFSNGFDFLIYFGESNLINDIFDNSYKSFNY